MLPRNGQHILTVNRSIQIQELLLNAHVNNCVYNISAPVQDPQVVPEPSDTVRLIAFVA